MRRTRRRTISLLVPFFLLSATLLEADTYPRQPGVDALHYVFRLTITDASNEITGESTATIRFSTAGVNEVALDLVKAAGDTGMAVSAVACGGKPRPFVHDGDRLRITLPQSSSPGDELTCTTIVQGGAARRVAPHEQHPR